MKHEKKIIETTNAPKAIGPYSVGITAGPFVFTAGQIGINPDNGQVVEGGIVPETHQALKNIKAILEAAGSSLDLAVKVTIFITNIGDFGKLNEVYGTYFTKNPPARAVVEVKGLPKGASVEIEAVGLLEGSC